MRLLGIILLIFGILAFIYTGFTYTRKEKLLEVGNVEVTTQKKEQISWPPIVGVVLSVVGIALIVLNKK